MLNLRWYALACSLFLVLGCDSKPAAHSGKRQIVTGEKPVLPEQPVASNQEAPPQPATAESQAAAVAVIEKAIRAHGGASALERSRTMIRTMPGTIVRGGIEQPLTSEVTVELPERLRLQLEIGTEKTSVLAIVNGNSGWEVVGGMTNDMARERLKEAHEYMRILDASSLTPLLRDQEYQLQALPDSKVNDRAARVVKAAHKDQGEMQLFFDKESGLLVKLAQKTSLGDFKVNREYFLEEYKPFNGVQLPTRIIEKVDGRAVITGHSASYQFPARIEKSKFARP